MSVKIFDPADFPFSFHSVHVWHKGELIQEEYFKPYDAKRLHRMFSISKSMTSLAIGALMAEKKLSMTDHIVDFYGEYKKGEWHPYLAEMTLHDMLTMRTCYRSTTYKVTTQTSWVESFFVTKPDHRPGTIFKYDTSSAHTMADLVKKLTGRGVLDYLRDIYLDELGFSADAEILKDPYGVEMGGSGLLCRPKDLLNLGIFLLSLLDDSYKEKYPALIKNEAPYDEAFWQRYADYVKDALSFHTPTPHEAKTLDEAQGYGYQFWRLRDGVMMYGMGGQYLIMYPQKDLLIVTTADAQPMAGGTQYILDEARRVFLSAVAKENGSSTEQIPSLPLRLLPGGKKEVAGEDIPKAEFPKEELSKEEKSKEEMPKEGALAFPYGRWRFSENAKGFTTLELKENELILTQKKIANGDIPEGATNTKSDSWTFRFPFSPKEKVECRNEKYGQLLYTKGTVEPDGSLYLRSDIVDAYVGCIHIVLSSKDSGKHLSVYLRKIEETYFREFDGFFECEIMR